MNYKKELLNYLFQQVEQNNLEEVKLMFDKYPELRKDPKELRANNNWTPDLFSAWFGYTEMLKFFLSEIYQNQNNKIMTNLIVLNIHSGSLKTAYFLDGITNNTAEDIYQFFKNSCLLMKKRMSLFYFLWGAIMSYQQNAQEDGLRDFNYDEILQHPAYNMYSKNGNLYTIKDVLIERDKYKETILRTNEINADLMMNLVKHYKQFNGLMIKELADRQISEVGLTSWNQCQDVI